MRIPTTTADPIKSRCSKLALRPEKRFSVTPTVNAKMDNQLGLVIKEDRLDDIQVSQAWVSPTK